MPDSADLDVLESDHEADDKTDLKKPKPEVNYENKYKGLTKTYSTLQSRFEKLQLEHDELNGKHEEAEAKIRGLEKGGDKRVKELEGNLAKATDEATTWKLKAEKADSEKAIRKTIKDKFAEKADALLEMFDADDLKDPASFEKPEDYEAYLARTAAKIVPKPATSEAETPAEGDADNPTPMNEVWNKNNRRDQLAGTTPSVDLSRAGQKVRTVDEIQDAFDQLDHNDPLYGRKFIELEKEMNTRMADPKR